ncbi:MAG: NAD(P)-dependent oxidoreductase [Solirubrobacteraceae bacterium]
MGLPGTLHPKSHRSAAIGYGNVGKRVARRAAAFGMAVSVYGSSRLPTASGAERCRHALCVWRVARRGLARSVRPASVSRRALAVRRRLASAGGSLRHTTRRCCRQPRHDPDARLTEIA